MDVWDTEGGLYIGLAREGYLSNLGEMTSFAPI
jgi:hypothetical protein